MVFDDALPVCCRPDAPCGSKACTASHPLSLRLTKADAERGTQSCAFVLRACIAMDLFMPQDMSRVVKCVGAQMHWRVMPMMWTVPQSWQRSLRLIRQASSRRLTARMSHGQQLMVFGWPLTCGPFEHEYNAILQEGSHSGEARPAICPDLLSHRWGSQACSSAAERHACEAFRPCLAWATDTAGNSPPLLAPAQCLNRQR